MPLLRKTPAGQAEVATKAHALPPRARSLLIMIDGKRGMTDLRAMLGPQVDDAAELLLREGLVEVVAAVTAPAPLDALPARGAAAAEADDSLPAPPVPPEPVDWKEQRAAAARAVTQAMGPLGDELSLRIERCKNEDELIGALRRAADLLDIAASRDQAAAFRKRFSPG